MWFWERGRVSCGCAQVFARGIAPRAGRRAVPRSGCRSERRVPVRQRHYTEGAALNLAAARCGALCPALVPGHVLSSDVQPVPTLTTYRSAVSYSSHTHQQLISISPRSFAQELARTEPQPH